jgi:biopolymer transport protein ExbB
MNSRMVQTVLFTAVAAAIGLVLRWRVEMIRIGGPVMVPIIMGSVFALTITIERLVYFFKLHGQTSGFLAELGALVHAHKWREADALCARTIGPVSAVAKAGLSARGRPAEERSRVVEEAVHEQIPVLEHHHRLLGSIAQVSTLMGLLGTITGMVATFQVIQARAGSAGGVNPADVAGGIWEALITTVGGLVVAIPTILAYNYLTGRAMEVEHQMGTASRVVGGAE